MIPSIPSQTGKHQENQWQQILARMQMKMTLTHCWWECKLQQLLWKSLWRFLNKLKINLYKLLSIYLKKFKSIYQGDTCIPMFISALFTIANVWNHLNCLNIAEWIKKIIHGTYI
jgi:hypothetical protein